MEGETADEAVNALRDRQRRNFLTTLLLSHGVPMVLAGDELGRTQRGNNNAYCQDNELSWIDWELDERAEALQAFAKRLIALRIAHPVFRRPTFLTGKEQEDSGAPDVWWFRPDGRAMTRSDWERDDASAIGAFLNGAELMAETREGDPIVGDSFLVLFNAWRDALAFRLPPARFGRRWAIELSTADPELEAGAWEVPVRGEVEVAGRSVVVLRRTG